MQSRHIIIGGGGFIGRHVSRALLERGHFVGIADRSVTKYSIQATCCLALDLTTVSVEELMKIINDYDIIHHYAWSTIPHTANEDPIGDLYQNVGSTLKILEAARRLGGRRIIFSSSGGTVYGKLKSVPAEESHVLDPITAYGISKMTCENYLRYFHSQFGIDARIARISNPYGTGQSADRRQGVISTFVYNALIRGEIEVFGDGSIVRDFIHILDLADALVRLSNLEISGSDGPRIYNIGGGTGYSIDSIVALVTQILDVPFVVKRSKGRNFDVPINVLDISLAKKQLDWSPYISVESGIRRMVKDLKSNKNSIFSS